jgi:hypothetical protein
MPFQPRVIWFGGFVVVLVSLSGLELLPTRAIC